MAASIFIETARPPASSAGAVIFEPLERRARLFWSIELLWLRLRAAVEAAVFVLITRLMLLFLPWIITNYDFRVATGHFWIGV
jgi:hypothetical protein